MSGARPLGERCPLEDLLYWQNEKHGKIPETCLLQCEDLMDNALMGVATETDIFDANCRHTVEYDDMSLQRSDGARRFVSVLSICEVDGTEAFAETYVFECPYN